MNLRSVNQNLLPVLHALLRERNVSRAASNLGLTQPAASKALDQLRGILGDPLLVRSGRAMILTRRGEELVGPVSEACSALEAIWRTVEFDPSQAVREFKIAGSDYTAALIVPQLAPSFRAVAPGLSLRFLDDAPDALLDDRIDIDFALAPLEVISPRLERTAVVTPLFLDEFVTVVGSSHPLADRRRLHPQDIARAVRIGFGHETPFLASGVVDAQPFGKAAGPTLALVQQFSLLPLLALLTDAVAIVPRRLAERLALHLPLRILEGGVPPSKVEIAIIWTTKHDRDPAHRWLRSLVIAQMRDERFR